MASITETRYSEALSAYRTMQERRREDRAAYTDEQMIAARDSMVAAWERADREWYASLGPVGMAREGTGIKLIRAATAGGTSEFVGPENPRYAPLLAKLEQQERSDAAIAELAYAEWGWRGPVKISHYGETALVSRGGGRKVAVDTATMRVRG